MVILGLQAIGGHAHFNARPEMVNCGSGQGRSEFETGGLAALRRGFQLSENAGLGRKMPFLVGH